MRPVAWKCFIAGVCLSLAVVLGVGAAQPDTGTDAPSAGEADSSGFDLTKATDEQLRRRLVELAAEKAKTYTRAEMQRMIAAVEESRDATAEQKAERERAEREASERVDQALKAINEVAQEHPNTNGGLNAAVALQLLRSDLTGRLGLGLGGDAPADDAQKLTPGRFVVEAGDGERAYVIDTATGQVWRQGYEDITAPKIGGPRQ